MKDAYEYCKLAIYCHFIKKYNVASLQCSQFSPISSLRTPHSLLARARYGVSLVGSNSWFQSEFKVWLMFCLSRHSDVYTIMFYWNALLQHSTVITKDTHTSWVWYKMSFVVLGHVVCRPFPGLPSSPGTLSYHIVVNSLRPSDAYMRQ